MAYRRLGRSGLSVSAVAFGTSQLRMVPEREAMDVLLRGFELGVNLVHTAPDYEGTEQIVARAIGHATNPEAILVCTQAYDRHCKEKEPVDHFKRLFEQSCERFRRSRLDVFGIACIDDREAHRENVWGPGGMVEFMLQMKSEGRIGAAFCSTHGDAAYISRLIDSGVFDAIMLAYNPLGFHLLSYHPPPGRTFEDLPSTEREVFPLARARDVGLMVMKPLGGGLLSAPKAFPWRKGFPDGADSRLNAADILKHILQYPEVSCVVPGTANLVEAEENARAGHMPTALPSRWESELASGVEALRANLCSRCGACEALCSRGLPISWLFRGVYVAMHPGAAYENWDAVEYFRLHPGLEAACSRCTEVTCQCPEGIDIPRQLTQVHEAMVSLRSQGLVRTMQRSLDDEVLVIGILCMRLLIADIPERLQPGEEGIARVWIENAGTEVWHLDGIRPQLRVKIGGSPPRSHELRDTVRPGESAHFVFDLRAPFASGPVSVSLELVSHRRWLGPWRLERVNLPKRILHVGPVPNPKIPGRVLD